VLALLPAVCEELVFRGVLARGVRPAAGRAIAIGASAIAFGAYHLQLSRLVPLSLFGALLAALAIASDSIWPAVVAHFLNNAIAIAISTGYLDPIAAIVSAHPDLALAASLAVTVAGLVIALAPRRAA
jgi:membrane protease YdiL (CAAX protease family)